MVKTVLRHGVRKWQILAKQVTYIVTVQWNLLLVKNSKDMIIFH